MFHVETGNHIWIRKQPRATNNWLKQLFTEPKLVRKSKLGFPTLAIDQTPDDCQLPAGTNVSLAHFFSYFHKELHNMIKSRTL